MAETLLAQYLGYLWIFVTYFSWWVIPLFMLIYAKTKWSRFPIEVIILEKRGDNFIKTNDRAGRFVDGSTGHTVYKLLKTGDTIDVLPFETVLHNSVVNTNFLELLINKLRSTVGTVHLLKYGSKQYKPIKISASEKGEMAQDENGNFIAVKEMKDERGNLVYTQNLQPFDIRKHMGVIDFQIIDWDDVNTTLNEIENSRIRRVARWDTWAKFLLPLAILGVAAIVCIVTIYLTYDAQLQFCNTPSQPVETEPKLQAEDQTLNIIGITDQAQQNP